jgi:hypothetical protein
MIYQVLILCGITVQLLNRKYKDQIRKGHKLVC